MLFRSLGIRMVMRNAYLHARGAIIDSNATTVITSIILIWLGSEEVKGFGLTLLIGLGMAGVGYILPITTAIVVLLAIVYFSYQQTMQAYPHGGGSYTVASENLGTGVGLLAAAPVLLAGPRTDFHRMIDAVGVRSEWNVGWDFAWANRDRYLSLLFLARLPVPPLS